MKALERTLKSLVAGMSCLALAATVSSCSSPEAGSAGGAGASGQEVNVSIQGLNLQTLYPLAAQDLGYFDRSGANVKVTVNTGAGGQAIQAMMGGSYQMFFGGADSIIATSLGEKNLRVIAAGANSSIWNLLTKPDIKDIKALEGKKIAVLSDQGLLTQAVRHALEANGLSEDAVTLLPAGNTPQRVAALSSGQADAAVVSTPQNTAAVEQSGYTDLGDLGDLGAPRLVTIALQVDDRWASSHREDVEKVLQGYHALVQDLYSGKNDDKIVPYFADKLGVEAKYIEAAFNTTFRADSPDPKQLPEDLAVDVEALQNTADSFLKYGAINNKVNVQDIVDNSYLEAAVK